jgi:hypothetical protein
VRIDLGSELDLLELGPGLLTAGLFLADVALISVLAVVHDPTHGRIGLRRDLDQIEIHLSGPAERLGRGNHADLLAVVSDESDLGSPDPVVDPRIG